jgi:Ribbon-helix-helix protein, copG family
MPSPKLSVRVSPETYATLLKLAEVERVSLTDLVRELIELGLGKKAKPEEDEITVLERIDAMNADVWEANKVLLEFLGRGIKAAAGARYFAALSVDLTNQLTQLVSTSEVGKTGQVHPDSATQQMTQWVKKAEDIEARYLLELD